MGTSTGNFRIWRFLAGTAMAFLVLAVCNHATSEAQPPLPRVPVPAVTQRSTIPIGIKMNLASLEGAALLQRVELMRSAGVRYTREDMKWDVIEPRPGLFRWRSTDRWVAAAAGAGIRIVAIPDAPPSWVTPNWAIAPTARIPKAEYASFVAKLVHRYGKGGVFWRKHPLIPAAPIRLWDIWDEPYCPRFWARRFPDPVGYARMFVAAARAGLVVDPKAKFMLEADLSPLRISPRTPFLGKMLGSVPALRRFVGAVSIHPYTPEPPTVCHRTSDRANWVLRRFDFCRIRDIRRVLASHGLRRAPIWVTEIGWNTAPAGVDSVTEQQQARYVEQTFSELRGRLKGDVQGLIWYSYVTGESNPRDKEGYFGLVHGDGTPKPAWTTFLLELEQGIPPA